MTDALTALDPILHLFAAVAYAAAFVALVIDVIMGRPGWRRAATVLFWAAVLTHVMGIAARWLVVGHGPYVTKYENLSSYALATAAIVGYLMSRKGGLRQLGLLLLPVCFLLLGIGIYTGPASKELPPTFSGIWLVLHVCFYFLAFSTAVTAVGASVLHVSGERFRPRLGDRLPPAEVLDQTAYRFAGLAFAFWGIGMLTGAIWAYHAWGRYWGWDPVETWSLITWFVFGIYLHVRRFYNVSGRKAAWLLALSFILGLIALFGTTLVSNSLHAVYFR